MYVFTRKCVLHPIIVILYSHLYPSLLYGSDLYLSRVAAAAYIGEFWGFGRGACIKVYWPVQKSNHLCTLNRFTGRTRRFDGRGSAVVWPETLHHPGRKGFGKQERKHKHSQSLNKSVQRFNSSSQYRYRNLLFLRSRFKL